MRIATLRRRRSAEFYKEVPREEAMFLDATLFSRKFRLLYVAILVTPLPFAIYWPGPALGAGLGAMLAINLVRFLLLREILRRSFTITQEGISGYDALYDERLSVGWEDFKSLRVWAEAPVDAIGDARLAPRPSIVTEWRPEGPLLDEFGAPDLVRGVSIEVPGHEDTWFRVNGREAVEAILRGYAWYRSEYPS